MRNKSYRWSYEEARYINEKLKKKRTVSSLEKEFMLSEMNHLFKTTATKKQLTRKMKFMRGKNPELQVKYQPKKNVLGDTEEVKRELEEIQKLDKKTSFWNKIINFLKGE
jgi:hypothetical protein